MSSTVKNVKNLAGARYRLVDASGEVLGRLASRLAMAIQGKDKPTYTPGSGAGRRRRERGRGGAHGEKDGEEAVSPAHRIRRGLVTRTAREMFDRDPTFALRKAVERMLPRNVRSKETMRKLRVFPGAEHAFDESRLVRLEAPPRALSKPPDARAPEGMIAFNPEAYAKKAALAKRSEEARATFARRAARARRTRRARVDDARSGVCWWIF
ncbi:ribosomal protein L13 domain-containing protein [Ostreococcus tauri]|uniref:Ribosomal protein L13 domain-containing protein n=1 Tax=Ostreococcus tauri TaxID=70448 RepID=A0A1Y5I2F2_OSTTA|nr:ribosomal protein L13 domain-containing protein [Ostreococcus tauri]